MYLSLIFLIAFDNDFSAVETASERDYKSFSKNSEFRLPLRSVLVNGGACGFVGISLCRIQLRQKCIRTLSVNAAS